MARMVMVLLLLGLGGLGATPALADEPKSFGVFSDWEAVSFKDAKGKVCYITSRPKKADTTIKNRALTAVMVTHRPAEKTFDVVDFIAGYNYKEGSKATVEIDDQKLTLFTVGNAAWAWDNPTADDQATDKKLVDAMRKGTSLVLRGTTARGTETTDTYSLIGFNKAYTAIGAACGVKVVPLPPPPPSG
jgi:invasion protein IalB